ncbi:MAG: ABC transporter permease [Deltaproteobacteria bacterium]|nr:ABC transporter permease [Deltaproteobacteria bacterium]
MILAFHLRVAWRSLSRTPWFSLAMVGSMAVGAAVWIIARTTVVAQGALSLPGRPVFHAGLDRVGPDLSEGDLRNVQAFTSALVSWTDAEALLARAPGAATMTWASRAVIAAHGHPAAALETRACSRAFFALFGFRFSQGGPWSAAADRPGAVQPGAPDSEADALPPVVLDARTAGRLLGASAVGRTVSVGGRDFRVVGVLEPYQRMKIYDLKFIVQTRPDEVYLPVHEAAGLGLWPEIVVAGAPHGGSMADLMASDDHWVHVWLELPDAAARTTYQRAVASWISTLPERRPAIATLRLRSADHWQRENFRTFSGYQLFYLFGTLLFAACVLNLIRLLLAKFSSRAHLVGVHRALGASKRSVFLQHLIEAELVGLGAGVLGLGLSLLGFSVINQLILDRPVVFLLDLEGALVLLGAATAAGLVAGVYPAWRTSNLVPAVFLRQG